MGALQKHRDCLIATASALFRRQGYAATGLAELLAASGAPRGSLYHYFPDGKEGVAVAAMETAGQAMVQSLRALDAAHADYAAMVTAFGAFMAARLEKSGFRDGCPIGTVMLEAAPASAKLTQAGREAFTSWAEVLAAKLMAGGIARPRAEALAEFTIGAFEGALLLARVRQSTAPILRAAEEIGTLWAMTADNKEPG